MKFTKETTFNEFLDQTLIHITKEKIFEKSLKVREELTTATDQMGANPMLSMFMPSQADIDMYVNDLTGTISLMKNMGDLKIFLNQNSFDSAKLFSGDAMSNPQELIGSLMSGGTGSFSKVILNMQFGGTLKKLGEVIEMINSIKPKIGADEQLGNIDVEDLDYLLSTLLTNDMDKLRKFLTSNPKDAESVITEFATLEETKVWELRDKSIEIIEKYFLNFKSQDIMGSIQAMQGMEDIENIDMGGDIQEYIEVATNVSTLKDLIKTSIVLINELNKVNA
ncbi:hypothetical protein [[Acholeplasma] multilocale]|uniref:hypothetical protein n=1 Tax=[Acholeplasma] multilocale TaxID=264638 RepID=UPI00047885C7|nr:hypothetical protein [[Acholeplasma] multilocale]